MDFERYVVVDTFFEMDLVLDGGGEGSLGESLLDG